MVIAEAVTPGSQVPSYAGNKRRLSANKQTMQGYLINEPKHVLLDLRQRMLWSVPMERAT